MRNKLFLLLASMMLTLTVVCVMVSVYYLTQGIDWTGIDIPFVQL